MAFENVLSHYSLHLPVRQEGQAQTYPARANKGIRVYRATFFVTLSRKKEAKKP